MIVAESNYYEFEEYKNIVEKYVNNDAREICFQNRVIVCLLEKIFINEENIWIVDVSTQFKNKKSKNHTRNPYAGEQTPDLLVAENWAYKNENRNINYYVVIEVKSPILNKNVVKDLTDIKLLEELTDYIQHIDKVILTDCHMWRFFEKIKTMPKLKQKLTAQFEEVSVEKFTLTNGEDEKRIILRVTNKQNNEWIMEEKKQFILHDGKNWITKKISSDIPFEIKGTPLTVTFSINEPENWKEFLDYIKDFVLPQQKNE